MLTSSQGSDKVEKNKNIISRLLTILFCLLITLILSYTFYNKYAIKSDVSNVKIDDQNNKQEEIIEIVNDKQDDLVSDSEVKEEIKPSDTPISNSLNETKTTKKDVDTKKNNTTNKSNNSNKTNTSKSNSSSEKQVSIVKEEQKETKVETTTNDDKKEILVIKQEEKKEESKSVEITIETPSKSSFENDSAYINLMKQIFSTFEECDNKGREIRLSDMVNISATRCESVNYKGTEVGWRLKIRYTDGTWKEYKK